MLSGSCALPVLICLMAENSSLMEKGAEKELSTLGAIQSLVHFCFTRRVWALFASLNFSLSSSWCAIELAVTGQRLGWELRPVRKLKVIRATLLEWVKSMLCTVPPKVV